MRGATFVGRASGRGGASARLAGSGAEAPRGLKPAPQLSGIGLGRPVAALFLLAGALHAQIAFFTGEEKLGDAYQLPPIAAGGMAEARLRLKNLGAADTPVSSLAVSGAAFSLVKPPVLPQSLAPGGALDFTVRFEPAEAGAYSASLRANDASLLLAAHAAPAALLYLDYGGALRLISGAADVDFGVVERGTPASRKFLLRNPEGQPAVFVRVSVEGAAFRLGATLAPVLLPSGETLRFEVLCDPAASGPQEAVLRIDERRYALRAAAIDPPLPRPELVVDLPSARSGQQGSVSVRLAARSETRASGQVRLLFQPAAAGASSDPTVVFAAGGRTVPFSVEVGDTMARFAGRSSAEFQTGSTAGTITMVLELERYSDQKSVTIPPSPVGISSGKATRVGSTLEVEIAGFDNTRTASRLAFTFYDRNGAAIAPGAVRADATTDFRRYFEGTDLGGLFAMRARFPVTGDAAAIDAVEIEIVNGAGAARSARLRLP